MIDLPPGYRLERGFLWPAEDVQAAAVVFEFSADLAIAYEHCRGFDVAVQAGGNCGIWPKAMGEKFGTVYTFEPDPVNFRCLCANAPAENVVKFNAALGSTHEMVGLETRSDNAGAHQIDGSGVIPTMLIDDLSLTQCDLIYLDIEGYEHRAIHGARETIARCRPVIAFEDKGLSQRYGTKRGDLELMLEAIGYRVVARPHRDVVMVP